MVCIFLPGEQKLTHYVRSALAFINPTNSLAFTLPIGINSLVEKYISLLRQEIKLVNFMTKLANKPVC